MDFLLFKLGDQHGRRLHVPVDAGLQFRGRVLRRVVLLLGLRQLHRHFMQLRLQVVAVDLGCRLGIECGDLLREAIADGADVFRKKRRNEFPARHGVLLGEP
ncbi:hypothetical protein [Burkholderia ubonensis]|uniref:hypothetical protein n=2 Tax=Burkholderia ubonensis TaxID=101571 RepID=UPI00210CE459|nr:hypothetical protein [Burkholderia ubonensis]